MRFTEYEYVLALAEEKSFSKAAKRLFISQPSLSQFISRVEGELDVVLFDRSGVPLKLTYEGELYVETAKNIMNLQRQLSMKLDDLKKLEKGRLTIGLTPSRALHQMPLILPVFKDLYPQIDLFITESSSAELEELLEKRIVDISVLNLPITSGNIKSESIFTERILLIAPKTGGMNQSVSYADIKQFENDKFILLQHGQRLRQISSDIFARAKFKPKILLETRNIETAVRLACSGMGLTFAPESFVGEDYIKSRPDIHTIGEPPLTWTIGAAYMKDHYISKAAKAFIQMTKEWNNKDI